VVTELSEADIPRNSCAVDAGVTEISVSAGVFAKLQPQNWVSPAVAYWDVWWDGWNCFSMNHDSTSTGTVGKQEGILG
jgi:hypothetical protein